MKLIARLLAVAVICTAGGIVPTGPVAAQQADNYPDSDWPYYGNDLGSMRYVDIDQINPGNVA